MSMLNKVQENVGLAEWTSWKVGGKAEFYCAPETISELNETLQLAYKKKWPTTLLGGGTNVLIHDDGISGLVIHTSKLNQIKVVQDKENLLIEAECGASKSEVLKHFIRYRLAPATFLAGLPGDMAGGVVMNAGVGHSVEPKEFCEIVHSVEVTMIDRNGKLIHKVLTSKDIEWSYRRSRGWQPGVITKVLVQWPMVPGDQILRQVKEGNQRRKSSQPLHLPSCGSVFKNPNNDHAGHLIESAGLKGYQIGGAQVSEKHANFIVNTGDATAKEIDQLIGYVQKTVKENFDIQLTNEVVYLGDW